jgi:hypothetical protein
MIIKVRPIVKGYAEGDAIITNQPINFLAMIDKDGIIIDKNHELYKQSIAYKILIFPNAIGSSVGAYTIYRLKRDNLAPKGIICKEADIITASGCAIANIPLVDKPEYSIKINGKIIINNDEVII